MFFKTFFKSAIIFFLFPVFLLGMESSSQKATHNSWTVVDKQKNNVTLEWFKVTDYKTLFALEEQFAYVVAQAFADEIKDCLLDDKLQIKKEYADIVKAASQSDREELDPLIKGASTSRKDRVEYQLKNFFDQIEMAKTEVAKNKEAFTQTIFVVFVKDEKEKIIGSAAFRSEQEWLTDGAVSLDLLAVDPQAQGRGLARFLVFSILKLMPETKRITLGTRIWNTNAQAVYKKLGFIEGKKNGCYVSFEYEVKK